MVKRGDRSRPVSASPAVRVPFPASSLVEGTYQVGESSARTMWRVARCSDRPHGEERPADRILYRRASRSSSCPARPCGGSAGSPCALQFFFPAQARRAAEASGGEGREGQRARECAKETSSSALVRPWPTDRAESHPAREWPSVDRRSVYCGGRPSVSIAPAWPPPEARGGYCPAAILSDLVRVYPAVVGPLQYRTTARWASSTG